MKYPYIHTLLVVATLIVIASAVATSLYEVAGFFVIILVIGVAALATEINKWYANYTYTKNNNTFKD
jgi:hypothetical protein